MEPNEKNINDLQNKIWYIIKHDEDTGGNHNPQNLVNTNEDYYICLNDIVKLGRVKYAANEIFIAKNSENVMDVDSEFMVSNNPYNISAINSGTQPVFDFIYKATSPFIMEDIMCKICLANNNDILNPLVNLCRCTGGIRYSHYDCLKKWMQTKLSIKQNGNKNTVTSYNIKSFNCEICKTPYPCK